jgi:hypothetical protein
MGLLLLFSGPGTPAPPAVTVTVEATIEAAFGYGPKDTTLVWVDISDYVRTCFWQHGRQNELNQTQAGTANLTLKDPGSDWDPDNTGSPFYPDVKPGLPVRGYLTVTEDITVNTYALFRGSVERLPRTSRVANTYTERQVDLIDGFALLSQASLGGFSYPVQMSDERVTDALDDIGWPSTLRDIDVGSATLDAKTFASDDTTAAQTHLQQVADSENGILFVNGAGDIRFISRLSLYQSAFYTTPSATFRDANGSSGYPYQDLVPSYDIDNVYNRWTGTRENGRRPQTFEDFSSQNDYFLRAKQMQLLLATDTELTDATYWKLLSYAQPLNRVESITVMPATTPLDVDQLDASLAREVGDRITVLETPPGFGVEQEKEYVIQHVAGQINTGPLASMRMTFGLWPASTIDTTAWWLLGHATRGLLGTSTRVGY